MVICFITQQWHQNHWSQHQKHLLQKLLRVLALEEQRHWQVLGWSYGVHVTAKPLRKTVFHKYANIKLIYQSK